MSSFNAVDSRFDGSKIKFSLKQKLYAFSNLEKIKVMNISSMIRQMLIYNLNIISVEPAFKVSYIELFFTY